MALWIIIPVRAVAARQTQTAHNGDSTIWVSTSSTALRLFPYESICHTGRPLCRAQSPIEIHVLDVVPSPLIDIYVEIDSRWAQILTGGSRFAGGDSRSHGTISDDYYPNGKEISADTADINAAGINGTAPYDTSGSSKSEDLLQAKLREDLTYPRIIHADDVLQMSVPRSQNEVLPLPIKITSCEPVTQGVITAGTRVILTLRRPHEAPAGQRRTFDSGGSLNGAHENGDEDTVEDRFFLAAEEGSDLDGAPTSNHLRLLESDSAVALLHESRKSSDGSLEDIISLETPSNLLANSITPSRSPNVDHQPSSGLGISSASMTNSRSPQDGDVPTQIFTVQRLSQIIPDTALHPQPPRDADDKTRIFVETRALIKHRCFSGDWVRIEPVRQRYAEAHEGRSMETSQSAQMTKDWRLARVYGMPKSLSAALDCRVKDNSKQAALLAVEGPPRLPLQAAYIPPLLLANLKNPTHIRLQPLATGVPLSLGAAATTPNSAHSPLLNLLSPPLAKEVTLLRVSTPLSTDRYSQTAILVALKNYFEEKTRIVKTDDLLSVTVDVNLRLLVSQGQPHGEEQSEIDELLSATLDGASDLSSRISDEEKGHRMAWFKIGDIELESSGDETDVDAQDWGGTAVINPATTRLIQTGNVQSRLPSAVVNISVPYLGFDPARTLHRGATSSPARSRDTAQSHISTLRERLKGLVLVAISTPAIQLSLPPLSVLLHSEQRGVGQATVATCACADLGMHVFEIDAYEVLTGSELGGADVKAEGLLRARAERAVSCGPENCALLVKHIEVLTADRLISALRDVIKEVRVFMATTVDIDKVPPGLRSLFTHEIAVPVPDESERKRLLQDICEEKGVLLAPDVDLSGVALKTAALVAGDLIDLVDRAVFAQRLRIDRLVEHMSTFAPRSPQITLRDLRLAGGHLVQCVTQFDFDEAVDAARKSFSDSIGAPKIPTVTWEDVGGLANVKDAVMETIQLPLEHPELFAKGLKKRSGILFYGPPGTGKTLLAKAIATEFSLNFFSVKGPELLNMYIGESEANVRRVFQRARDARPCVIFFDELDSVAPKRGNQGDSGGVMDRIVSQLLAELDGMSNDDDDVGGVFVVGATNRPDLLDPALLRPGRFDKMMYLGISDTHEKQLRILQALTRKYAFFRFPLLISDRLKLPGSTLSTIRASIALLVDFLSPTLVRIFMLFAPMPC